MRALKAIAAVAAAAGAVAWLGWRWACGYDAITRSDSYERRNY